MTKNEFTANLSGYDVFWLTLWGEFRGQPIEEQVAGACVIRNRVRATGKTYKEVCLAPAQFSCWNENDPNFSQIVNLFKTYDTKNPLIKQLKYIATGVMDGELMDNTKNSNHYLTAALYKSNSCPIWAKLTIPNIIIGKTVFISCA
jgi:N-acetylmuramoyl-L-alanine amidase